MMRKKEAETDPNQQMRETIGSGPFLYNRDETRPGNRHVYDRNPNYVPRAEPPSAMSGGKVVKLDRVIFENIADEQTALSALQAGEIDFYEVPPQDLIDDLRKDTNLTVQVLNKTGHIALDAAQPPASAVQQSGCAAARCCYLVKQPDVMRAIFGKSKYWQTCGSYFACGTPMANDENTEWFKQGTERRQGKGAVPEGGLRRPARGRAAGDRPLSRQSGRAARRAMAAPGRHQCRSRRDRLGCGAHAPRREEAAGRRRLEHLLHHGDRHTLRGPDRVHRPRGERRAGLVRLAEQSTCRSSCATNGRLAPTLDGAQGDRKRDAEERLGLHPARHPRPVLPRLRLAQQHAAACSACPRWFAFWNMEKVARA